MDVERIICDSSYEKVKGVVSKRMVRRRASKKIEEEKEEEQIFVDESLPTSIASDNGDENSSETVQPENEGIDSSPLATELPTELTDVSQKDEGGEKKTKRKRKAKNDKLCKVSGGEEIEPPAPKKSKKDQLLEDFMMHQLPALRKEIKLRKKEEHSFNIRDYPDYFKPSSKIRPTYCLSLFNFLGKNEIECTQYGVFEGNKHLVKTIDGFNHMNLILSSVGPDLISPEEAEHMMKRFGKEWFKIPAKDAPRVSTAFRFGDQHRFRVVLTGIYEDSFFGEEGEIYTANPILRYEAIRPSPQKVKKEKKKEEEDVCVDQPIENPSEVL